MIKAVEFAHENISRRSAQTQEELAGKVGKPPVQYVPAARQALESRDRETISAGHERRSIKSAKKKGPRGRVQCDIIERQIVEELREQFPGTDRPGAFGIIDDMDGEIVRKRILDKRQTRRRPRPEGDPAHRHHAGNSAAGPRFRGVHPGRDAEPGHQTLGSVADAQRMDDIEGEGFKELHAPLPLSALLGRRDRHGTAASGAGKSVTACWRSVR